MNRALRANRSTTTIAAKHDAATPIKRTFEAATGPRTESGFDFGALPIHPAPLAIQRQMDPTSNPAHGAATSAAMAANQPPQPTGPVVYVCSRPLAFGSTHAFFRVGGGGVGKPTISLFAEKRGSGCLQGVPMKDGASDKTSAEATCEPTPIALSALEREFASYPIGHYCARGPNSNTFVGTAARNCGMTDPDPPGWNPGLDDAPPRAGTYTIAAEPEDTVWGCTTRDTCGLAATPPSGSPQPVPTYGVTPTPGRRP